ncbi:MAG: hypothetical protein RJB38_1561 [Pseudomonadota bacterium]|jgi:hypothetical protein
MDRSYLIEASYTKIRTLPRHRVEFQDVWWSPINLAIIWLNSSKRSKKALGFPFPDLAPRQSVAYCLHTLMGIHYPEDRP